MYSKETMKHFTNPSHVGELKNPDGVGEVGNVTCGDIMKMSLKVENNIIKDIKFKTYGCVAAIASSDMVCEAVKGKTIDEALNMKPKDIIKNLGDLPAVKYHCAGLGIESLKKAILDYKNKKNKKSKNQ